MALHTIRKVLAGETQIIATRTPAKQIIIQNETGNGNIDVHGTTPSTLGFIVAGGAVSPVLGPFSGEFPLDVSQLRITGTNGQFVVCIWVS